MMDDLRLTIWTTRGSVFRRLFSSQLRINIVSGVGMMVISAIAALAGYPIYLRFLGYEQYGLWLVLSAVLSVAQLGNLGVGYAVTKLVAEEYERGDTKAIQEYIVSALGILVLSGAVALSIILLFRMPIVNLFRLSEANAQTVLWLLPFAGCLSVYVLIVQAVNAALSGLGRMDLANYAQTAGRVVTVSVATFLLACGGGIESLLIANVGGYLLIHLTSFVLIKRIVPVRLFRTSNWSLPRARRLLGFGTRVFGGSLIGMLITPFNRVMISRYVGVASLSVYEIAYAASMQIRNIIEISLRALMPEVSRLGAQMLESARARVIHINRRAVAMIACLGIPMYLIPVTMAPLLLRLWLGARYTEVLPPLFRVIAVGSFFNLLGAPPYYTLMGLGRVQSVFTAHALQTATHVCILVGLFALAGAPSVNMVGWALLVSMAASMIYLLWQNHKALGTGWPTRAASRLDHCYDLYPVEGSE
jgi:O-antigen/teichoic acid export membrane protein